MIRKTDRHAAERSDLHGSLDAEICDATMGDAARSTVSTEDVLSRVLVDEAAPPPRMILALAPCRCGSTAFLRLFAESGVPSYAQPFKCIFRDRAKRKPAHVGSWVVHNDDWLFVKETSGPFGKAESTLDYLSLLVRVLSRYSPRSSTPQETIARARERLQVIVIGRAPADAWHSWLVAFEHLHRSVDVRDAWYYRTSREQLLNAFVLAYENVDRMAAMASTLGIPVFHYVYEALDFSNALPVLFRQLDLPMQPRFAGWTERSLIGGSNSLVRLTNDHSTQFRAGIFAAVNSSSGLFEPPPTPRDAFGEELVAVDAITHDIYDRWYARARQLLAGEGPAGQKGRYS